MEHKPDSQDNQAECAERTDDQANEQILDVNPKDSKNQKIRFGLLALFVGASFLILGRSLIDDSIGKPTPFVFPERIEFAQVQTQTSAATSPETIVDTKDFYGKPRYLSGKSYKYAVDNIPIDIAFRYAVGTNGDLFLYLKEYGNIEINEDDLRQKTVRDSTGYYAAFEYQNRAYVTACINPRGISTVTKEQFEDNASDRATDRDVVIGWLLGQKDLRDRRCLWTLMSTPIESDSDRNAANQKLEKTWTLWYEWWKLRFPQP
jgi:cyanosortase A-associated protein